MPLFEKNLSFLVANMEQDGSMLNPHLKQEQAAESWFLQHSQPQTTEGSKSSKKQSKSIKCSSLIFDTSYWLRSVVVMIEPK